MQINIVLMFFLYAIIGSFETPKILRDKKWKELLVYCTIFSLAILVFSLDKIFKVDFTVFSRYLAEIFDFSFV